MANMLGGAGNGELGRVIVDFVLAFALFWVVALTLSAGHGRAHAVPLPAMDSQAIRVDMAGSRHAGVHAVTATHTGNVFHRAQASREQTYLLLSIAIAAIVAFNLAFWRHLRRVYASPRRSVWRRG
jgi:hypothetical protein